ncbi:acyltransferase [gamma proteobacterium BDW918]|nr:acyltransferase [gamma proteobacterium BDW918]
MGTTDYTEKQKTRAFVKEKTEIIHSTYRKDIDGLRAIAVLATMAYHLKTPLLPGGFFGVDVFFAISGYLIIGQLLDAQESPTGIKWAAFYAKRVRRLLPANLLVLLCSLLIGAIVLWPGGDLQSFAKSAIAAALGIGNIFFWKIQFTDYFHMGGQPIPLLHTWSLGVEEQFYLCMPLLFGLTTYCFKRSRFSARNRLCAWLNIGVAISLILTAWTNQFHPQAGFYNVPTRAFEFFLGALVYVAVAPPSRRSTAEAACWVGLLCLTASFISFSNDQSTPGLWSLLPVIGCSLLLWGGRASGISTQKFLASSPLRWIGLRSYSIYLWHWPLLVFWREYTLYSRGIWSEILICLIAIALSDLSYRFVELPARNSTWSKSLSPRLAITLGVLASFTVIGIAGGTGLYSMTLKKQAPEIITALEETQIVRSCFSDAATPSHCNSGSPKEAKSVVVWGDSHAAHLKFALPHVAEQTNSYVVMSAKGGCPPVSSYTHPVSERRTACASLRDHSLKIIEEALKKGPTVVILAARWETYIYKKPISKRDKALIYQPEGDSDSAESFATKLSSTIAFIAAQGAAVVLIAPIPEQELHIPKCQYKNILNNRCSVSKKNIDEYQVQSLQILLDIVNVIPNVSLLSVNDIFCDEQLCYGIHKDKALYFDDDHLSRDGAHMLQNKLAREVNAAFSNLGYSNRTN